MANFTFERIQEFNLHAAVYRRRFDKIGRPIPNPPFETKFEYAIDRMVSLCDRATKKDREDLAYRQEDIRTENSTTVEREGKQVMLKEGDGKYILSAEADRKIRKEFRKLEDEMAKKTYEIEPYMAQGELPKDITYAQWEAFRGFVIPDTDMPEPGEKTESEEPIDVVVNGVK